MSCLLEIGTLSSPSSDKEAIGLGLIDKKLIAVCSAVHPFVCSKLRSNV